jgi:hypothetical protein
MAEMMVGAREILKRMRKESGIGKANGAHPSIRDLVVENDTGLRAVEHFQSMCMPAKLSASPASPVMASANWSGPDRPASAGRREIRVGGTLYGATRGEIQAQRFQPYPKSRCATLVSQA